MTEQSRAASFDSVAEEYERGRPGWPDALLDLVPVSRAGTVLDLGAGTGKLTRTLVGRYVNVIAVEPLPAMRAILERELPSVQSHAGSAHAIPLADGAVDAVFCGQSAHWFSDDAAVGEIARVLRPGGVLVAAWNRPQPDRESPLPRAYERRLEELRPPLPEDLAWTRAVERGPFAAVQEAEVEHVHLTRRDDVLRLASSVSWIASRDDRGEIAAELAALLPPGEYRIPLRCDVAWAVRE